MKLEKPKIRARRGSKPLWFSSTPRARRSGSVSAAAAKPALTAQQRRDSIQREATGSIEPRILVPAAEPIVDFCRRHPLFAPIHLVGLSAVAGLLAGLFLIGDGASPLLRFWAGLFLFGCEVLNVAGRRLAHKTAPSTRIKMAQSVLPAAAGALVLFAATWAAADIHPSAIVWLLGLAAIASAAIHAVAFDAASTEYIFAAGGASPNGRENLLDLSMRAHDAMWRGDTRGARLWRFYAEFRAMQQQLVSRAPAGSADAFWRLNRRRMAMWTFLSPRAHVFCLCLAAVCSAFWPPALAFVLSLFVIPGNVLFLALLLAGWRHSVHA